MADTQPKPQIIDNPNVHAVYANKFVVGSFDGGAISLVLGTAGLVLDTQPPGTPPSINVTARLALSPTAAAELMNALNKILTTIAQGAASRKPATPSAPAAKSN